MVSPIRAVPAVAGPSPAAATLAVAEEPAKMINLRCVDGEIVEINTNIIKMIGIITDAYSSA